MLREVSTRLSFVSLLKTKDEALNRAKVTIQLLEVQSGLPLQSIRPDKGGEFVSQDWMNYCGGKGIYKQTTNAYSPRHNGICERLNITLT